MGAYLIDHPPVRSQYRNPRRAKPSGVIVIHTAENAPDFVAFDGGAEAVARFIQSRTTPGSYHELVDSGGPILMVPYGYEAFHDATGSNPHSLSISIATRADVWSLAPAKWRAGAVEQAARAAVRQAKWVKKTTGVTIPARRITREESERKVPGFISHAQRDPTRRTDPGKDFPWSDFLARYKALMAPPKPSPTPPPIEETEENMAGYSLWKNTTTNVTFRVADSALAKKAVSGSVLTVDILFAGQPVDADTSTLQAWLNSIPNV